MKASKNKIRGFSKLSKKEKTEWVEKHFLDQTGDLFLELSEFQHSDPNIQKRLDAFSENTLANFPMPYGVAPHFLINGKKTIVFPMVIEESSVVAAASNAAKFWASRNGIEAKVIDTTKIGQVHFYWSGQNDKLIHFFKSQKPELLKGCRDLTTQMEARGGGHYVNETN